jgi:hypothetical protein
MPNFELQLVERLAGMEKLLKTQPSPSQPAHHLGEQIITLFLKHISSDPQLQRSWVRSQYPSAQ